MNFVNQIGFDMGFIYRFSCKTGTKAEKIIEAFKEANSRGLGVTSLGTKMIDPPVVKRAFQTMTLAYQFGKRQPESK